MLWVDKEKPPKPPITIAIIIDWLIGHDDDAYYYFMCMIIIIIIIRA